MILSQILIFQENSDIILRKLLYYPKKTLMLSLENYDIISRKLWYHHEKTMILSKKKTLISSQEWYYLKKTIILIFMDNFYIGRENSDIIKGTLI